MRKVIVNEFLSLDGVAQAPGGEDEDVSGGFRHGGWHMDHTEDDRARGWVTKYIDEAGAFLLGRRTYEIFAGYWPNAPEEVQVIAEPLNTKPKHVVSTTLSDPLDWQNSTVLQGDLADAVAALKREDGGDLHVIGSTERAAGDVTLRRARHDRGKGDTRHGRRLELSRSGGRGDRRASRSSGALHEPAIRVESRPGGQNRLLDSCATASKPCL
jgi:dihydrofolate reductase